MLIQIYVCMSMFVNNCLYMNFIPSNNSTVFFLLLYENSENAKPLLKALIVPYVGIENSQSIPQISDRRSNSGFGFTGCLSVYLTLQNFLVCVHKSLVHRNFILFGNLSLQPHFCELINNKILNHKSNN